MTESQPHEFRELRYLDQAGEWSRASGDAVHSILAGGVLMSGVGKELVFIPWHRVLMLTIRRDDHAARRALDPSFSTGLGGPIFRGSADD